MKLIQKVHDQKFQSTPSSQKVTQFLGGLGDLEHISIHTFLTEGDLEQARQIVEDNEFQSTPSSQKATLTDIVKFQNGTFQSTPSSQKAT